ncbi:MAG: polysulfide reductase NrfD [Rhodospirillales bacterium]|jgi:formate-dependent nitrite reductase membrane component NrfD|nr:polysulfide reductase NrfD [Rhodospirillales bacterium]
MGELHWGLPVIGYLFLAGMGAGAMTVSASVLLRGGGGFFGGQHFRIARYGALIAPLPLMAGTGMIVFELGTFQVGMREFDFSLLFRWINLFKTLNMSPMSIGSWVLGLCIMLSLVYAWTFLSAHARDDDTFRQLRNALAWVSIPLGIAVAVYTGILLGAMPSRPFWNSQILGLLFMLSALSTGVAGILFLYAFHRTEENNHAARHDAGYILAASDAILIGFELLVIFLFIMFAHLTVGDPAHAIAVILPGGSLAVLFWIGVVVFGLVVPALVELHHVLPRLLHQKPYLVKRWVEVAIGAMVLGGGLLLRYVIVVAGQVTGPVGI